ncbi:MAG: flagellar biosynthetic protein FliO [Burkholderiaceae bacterium]
MNEADVLRVIISLIFILMLIMAGAWLVRRSGLNRGNTQALRVVASQNLGNRAWVTIIEVEDARLVLGITAQQVSLLHTLPPGQPSTEDRRAPPDAPDTPRFTAALTQALKRR